jgi:hypothetical protein
VSTERAWGWVAHLREGGTTPWRDWSATAEPVGTRLPGAQQLELLRLVNRVGSPGTEVADGLLAVDPPRRSRPDLPLLDGAPVPAYGPRPVDPADVPAEELVELLAVALAGRLARELPPAAPEPLLVRRRPWTPRYHLFGDPETVRALRRQLQAHGRPEATHGGRGIVLATDLGVLLADVWTNRALSVGGPAWGEWWRRCTRHDRLPGPADLQRVADEAWQRPGVRGVQLVTDPARAARMAGLRRPPPLPPPLAAVAVELGRQTVVALRPLVPPEVRERLVAELLRPRLETLAGPPLRVPAEHQAWVTAQADALIARLRRRPDRYPVRGDLAHVVPAGQPAPGAIRPRDTLAAGIRLLLADVEEAS